MFSSQSSLSRSLASRNPWVQQGPKWTFHLSQYVDHSSTTEFTFTESPELETADEESNPDRIEEDHAS